MRSFRSAGGEESNEKNTPAEAKPLVGSVRRSNHPPLSPFYFISSSPIFYVLILSSYLGVIPQLAAEKDSGPLRDGWNPPLVLAVISLRAHHVARGPPLAQHFGVAAVFVPQRLDRRGT